MSDNKFRCHVWCYNVPAAIVFFTVLLALCLAIIPFIEAKLIFDGSETGLEFVHAGVVWLCVLTLYMAVMQISKRKELMLNIEEYSTCFRNQTAETGDVTIDMACDESIMG
ncbi:hypothetical protein LSH36_396g05020, partial [Paralvinella palmiformis]